MTGVLQRLKTALADRYTLEHELGRGGMATVYLARDLSELERALARHPFRSLQPVDRPYLDLATAFARSGRVDRARALLAEYEQVRDSPLARPRLDLRRQAQKSLA